MELPLELETCDVDWVDANLRQTRIRVKLQSNERYGLLTGLDYIGRVAFVEQKTYLDPVSLPPKENVNYTPVIIAGVAGGVYWISWICIGDAGTCIGTFAFFMVLSVAVQLCTKKQQQNLQKSDQLLLKMG